MSITGRYLRAAREGAGVSLSRLAELTHWSKSTLGHIETGKRAVTGAHLAAYADALGLDLERLSAASDQSADVDAASLEDLASILSATRRLEDRVGAALVYPVVSGYAHLAGTLTCTAAAPLRADAAALASELDQYRGWLEIATGRRAAAERSLSRAVELGRESGHPDRLVHGLSFRAYAALESQDRARLHDAADLTDAALHVPGAHPLLRVYDRYQRARVHAASGEVRQAYEALLVADRAAEVTAGTDPPDSGYWYTSGLWGLHRGRVLWLTGERESAAREVAAGLAAMPQDHREAQWAAKWVRVALGGDL